MKERFRATLIGTALGDTLGMPVEGWKRQQIQKYVGKITEPIFPVILRDKQGELILKDEFGKLGYYSLTLLRGEYTDDTILTLAVAESISEKGGLDLNDVAQKHLDEYKERLLPTGKILGGFGATTIKALKNLDQGISPLESASSDGGPGNGPAMKMSPVGLYIYATSNKYQGIEFAKQVSEMTHQDPRSIASGMIQAHAIYRLLMGVSRDEFNNLVYEVCKWYERPTPKEYPHAEKGCLVDHLSWMLKNPSASDEEAFRFLGNDSLVFRSYPFALFMFQKYWDEPLKGLLETVNWGGDCDTTGAIYGSLMGAKNGMIFPSAWLDVLKGKDRLVKAAYGIFKLKKL